MFPDDNQATQLRDEGSYREAEKLIERVLRISPQNKDAEPFETGLGEHTMQKRNNLRPNRGSGPVLLPILLIGASISYAQQGRSGLPPLQLLPLWSLFLTRQWADHVA